MRIVDAGSNVTRADFHHHVFVDLVRFDAGIAWWRARCSCRWKSSVVTNDFEAAAETATSHCSGWVWGAGRDLFDAS